MSELSESERACLSDNGIEDPLSATSRLSGTEGTKILFECLEHDTELRMFLSAVVLEQRLTEPLSSESSQCIREGFEATDLAAITLGTVSPDGEVSSAAAGHMMAGVILALSCLNDEEYIAVGSAIVADPDTPETLRCLVDEMGGPEGIRSLLETDIGEPQPNSAFLAMVSCQSRLSGGS